MNNFLYAMIESFEKMKVEIHKVFNASNYAEKERNEIFFAVSICLHSILDYADRVKIKRKDIKLISAFKYANNSLKHCVEVRDLTKQRGGFSFPMHFELNIPKKEIVWSIVDNGGKDRKNQRNYYKVFLEGKDVIETCENVIEILKKYEL